MSVKTKAIQFLAVAVGVTALVALVVGSFGIASSGVGLAEFVDGWTLAEASIALNFTVVGMLLAARRPHNAVGWLLLLLGWQTASNLVDLANPLAANPLGLFALLLLLLPHGSLPSPRWRPVLGLLLIIMVVTAIGTAAGLELGGVEVWDRLEPLLVLSIPVAAASLVVRFRRADHGDRAALRLLALAAVVAVVAIFTGAMLEILPVVNAVAFPMIPWAIAAAVLRYRLYDVDRLVSRTVSYGLLTLSLASVYVGLVVAAQVVAGPEDAPDVVVAGATLVVAALFHPLRARLQIVIDRRFNRARYDALRIAESFGSRLRDEIDLANLESDLGDVVVRALHPRSVTLWVHPGQPR